MFRLLSKHPSLQVVMLGISISGCSNMEYVNNSTLREMGHTKRSRGIPTKNYGAIALPSTSFKAGEDQSRLILVGKQKSVFFAETMIHQSNKNTIINKSFLSIGADRKKKGALMQFRLVY